MQHPAHILVRNSIFETVRLSFPNAWPTKIAQPGWKGVVKGGINDSWWLLMENLESSGCPFVSLYYSSPRKIKCFSSERDHLSMSADVSAVYLHIDFIFRYIFNTYEYNCSLIIHFNIKYDFTKFWHPHSVCVGPPVGVRDSHYTQTYQHHCRALLHMLKYCSVDKVNVVKKVLKKVFHGTTLTWRTWHWVKCDSLMFSWLADCKKDTSVLLIGL